MADEGEKGAARRPRADAERNRLRLLAAAKIAFAEKGASASLEEIARAAGLGIGTLYRHFPTRDALVAAVYRNETERLAAAAARLSETAPPAKALREWLLLFVDYMATKHGMIEALNAIAGGPSGLHASSGGQAFDAVKRLVARAVAAGEIRWDDDPVDLLRALAGVAHVGAGPEGAAAARRLVDVLIGGMATRR